MGISCFLKVFFQNALIKTAKMSQIFITDDSYSTTNYIHISTIPSLSKMFKKLICAGLDYWTIYYLLFNNIICTNQFGFPQNLSTSDAIIEFLDNVYPSLNNNQNTIAL